MHGVGANYIERAFKMAKFQNPVSTLQITYRSTYLYTVSAQIRGHSWLNRHLSTLFSKICQLLNILFSKISP